MLVSLGLVSRLIHWRTLGSKHRPKAGIDMEQMVSKAISDALTIADSDGS
jgi:hypothetical protein